MPNLKQETASAYLGASLIAMNPKDKLPPLRSVAASLGLSIGIVQNALIRLREEGVLSIETRGHMGAYISHIDRTRLTAFNRHYPCYCAMPLPYTLRYEALAGALFSALNPFFDFSFMHVRGSKHRLQLVQDGKTDCALLSRHAWEEQKTDGLKPVFSFGEGSYIKGYSLVLRIGVDLGNIRKVGVDFNSFDHIHISRETFSPDVEQVPLTYHALRHALNEGKIDAAVVNSDEVLGLPSQAIDSPLVASISEALIIIRKEDLRMEKICGELLHTESLRLCVRQILNGERNPQY